MTWRRFLNIFHGSRQTVETRFCEAHRQKCPKEGGGYIVGLGGLHHKWICYDAMRKRAKQA